MLAIIRYTLRSTGWLALAWGCVIAGVGALTVYAFDYIERNNRDVLVEFIRSLPEPLTAMAGGADQFLTPIGFLHGKFFLQAALMIGVFAIILGSGLFARDEEAGRLELLVAHPIHRRDLFWGRVFGLIIGLLIVLVMGYVGLAITIRQTEMAIPLTGLLNAFVTLFAVLLAFASLAILLSLVLPSRNIAAAAAGIVLLLSFMLTTLAALDHRMERVASLLPYHYYQGGIAIDDFQFVPLVWLILLSSGALAAAVWMFARRDFRVSGEGTISIQRLSTQLSTLLACYALWALSGAWLTAPPYFDTPAETFETAVTAFHAKDWETLLRCLSDGAKQQALTRMASLPGTTATDTADAGGPRTLDPATLESFYQSHAGTAHTAWKMFASLAEDLKLTGIQIEGNTAFGVLQLPTGRIEIPFVKERGGWKLDARDG